MEFPDDLNGDVLRRMSEGGDKLLAPRDVDFNVVFAEQHMAESFACHFRDLGYRVSVEMRGVNKDSPWEALVVKHMVPSHRAITDFEDLLQSVADEFNGRNDGWGCFRVLSS